MLLTKLANQEIVNFLRTVTIKNGYFADQLKKALVNEFYWTSLPIERNPYYMHMRGEYILSGDVVAEVSDPATGLKETQRYSCSFDIPNSDGVTSTRVSNVQVYVPEAFDTMMWVTSLDTQELIPFTVRNLHGDGSSGSHAVHKKTLKAYQIPGRYFDLLCEKYPTQVDLIKSIVYLVPPKELSEIEKGFYGSNLPDENELRIRNCLESDHLTYLYGDESILEKREKENILAELKSLLDTIRKRWDVKEYTFEENYPSVQWAMVWSLLPLILISQRYANIRGPHVHSSHVWDYLTSNGLDSYRGYLTSEQEWFLYKNIQYLRENSGQHKVLNYLIDNLLSTFNLHIESKTVVLDKTDITQEKDIGNAFSEQCKYCSRNEVCFKNITDYKCIDFIGRQDLFKPTPVILTENLPGARKDKIISLLMERYDCSEELAEYRYERSFVWRDSAIERIKDELDRDQSINVTGMTEELKDVIERENASGLEPVLSDDLIAEQNSLLRHIHSSYLPTKLLEIKEDPVEPKYSELFAKFVIDTLLHLAPYTKGNELVTRVSESYSVIVGQDALNFILTFNELIALLYLGFIRDESLNNKIDVNTGTSANPSVSTTFITDQISYPTFEIPIPSRASIGLTFKFGKPVKQTDLVDAYFNYVLDDSDIASLVTNGSDFRIVAIGTKKYAVSRRAIDSSEPDYIDWIDYKETNDSETHVYKYEVLGRFEEFGGNVSYIENDNEIGVIPRFFIWHHRHLAIKAYKDLEALQADRPDPEVNDIATVWILDPTNDNRRTKKLMIFGYDSAAGGNTWREFKQTDLDTVGQDVFIIARKSVSGVSTIEETKRVLIYNQLSDIEEELNDLREFGDFSEWSDKTTAEVYERYEIEKFVNVDWILENLWVDFLKSITSQEDIGEYFEKMFTIIERLDKIRSGCGDIKTRLAIDKFMDSVLIDKRVVEGTTSSNKTWDEKLKATRSFKLVNVGNITNPTYADWFAYNSEIGDNIHKLDSAIEKTNLWNELAVKLFQSLMVGCNLSYADNTTDRTRYLKLKALVKSLSSYLINFIDNKNDDRISTEIPHLSEEYPANSVEFTSYVNFNPVRESLDSISIGDAESTIFLPATEKFAREGVQYFVQDSTRVDEAHFVEATKVTGYSESSQSNIYGPVEAGDDLSGAQYYFAVNLKELLGIDSETRLKVYQEDGTWYYDTGYDTENEILVDTYPNDPEATIVKNATLTEHVKKLIGDKNDMNNLGSQVTKKSVLTSSIVWNEKPKTSKKLTELMNLMTCKFHLRTESTFEANLTKQVDSAIDLEGTIYPSQLTTN